MNEPSASVTRRKQQRQARRAQIIRAARSIFLEAGYAGMTMTALSAKLGGSKSTLWAYFSSKEDLFAAVVDDLTTALQEDILAALSPYDDLKTALSEFCRRLMVTLHTPEAVATWRLLAAESERFPEIGRVYFDRVAGVGRRTLSHFLGTYIENGALRPGNPDHMVHMLLSMCTSHQHLLLWGVENSEHIDVKSASVRYAEYFMRTFSFDT